MFSYCGLIERFSGLGPWSGFALTVLGLRVSVTETSSESISCPPHLLRFMQ